MTVQKELSTAEFIVANRPMIYQIRMIYGKGRAIIPKFMGTMVNPYYDIKPCIEFHTRDTVSMLREQTFTSYSLQCYDHSYIAIDEFPGVDIFNQLLSIVEDFTEMPIEEYTYGIFSYLSESDIML